MIGLISALSLEIEDLQKEMSQVEIVKIGMDTFYHGLLYGKEAVLAVCGAGKVNAALCTQSMILRFHPEWILNIGVAGAGNMNVHVCDVVLATATIQHDVDSSAIGDPVCMVSKINLVEIPCDTRLRERLKKAASSLENMRVHEGLIATGDQFISTLQQKERIRSLCDAKAVEMEGAAVAQACYMHGVPCGVLRSISDNAIDGGEVDYFQMRETVALQVHRIIRTLLSEED